MISQNLIISNGAKFSFSGLNSSLHLTAGAGKPSLVCICVEDKPKETGSDKELLDLANDDRFVGDTRHLVTMVVTK
jgi:hypothetical protein